MPRMKFLTDEECNQFDAPPTFSAAERKRFFNVTKGLNEILQTFKTPTNQVCFVISLGYFRATKRFFGREFREEEVRFVARRLGYFPEIVVVDTGTRMRWSSVHHVVKGKSYA